MTNEGSVRWLCNDLQKPVSKLIRSAKAQRMDFRLIVESEDSFKFVSVIKGKPVESNEMKTFVALTLQGQNVKVEGCLVSLKKEEIKTESKSLFCEEVIKKEIDSFAEEAPAKRKKKSQPESE